MMVRVARVLLILSAVLFLGPPPDTAFGAPVFVPQGRTANEESLAIIVNQSNPAENFSLEELRKIFLGERSHWPNGRRITLVMMGPGQPERKIVLRDICRMGESDFSRHFLHGLFTGEVFVSPKTLASPVGVRKFVFNVPGAIGYVRASDVDGSVKVVRVDERLPDDKEYKLRVPLEPPK
jgi:ABC-type phosphate transport system substrate-binding protein